MFLNIDLVFKKLFTTYPDIQCYYFTYEGLLIGEEAAE
jgi:hypothetical protein